MHSKTGSLKLVQKINHSVVLNLNKDRNDFAIRIYATIKNLPFLQKSE